MAYPGIVLGVMLAVAIGTAVYYLISNDGSTQQEQPYGYNYRRDSPTDTRNNSPIPNNSLRKRTRKNYDQTCTICQFPLENIAKTKTLPCDHSFHELCIGKWIGTQNSCPNCRKQL